MNGGCLPAFIATADALNNKKMNFKEYLDLLYDDLNKIRACKKADLCERLSTVTEDYDKAVRLWQVAAKIGKDNTVPHELKYWL